MILNMITERTVTALTEMGNSGRAGFSMWGAERVAVSQIHFTTCGIWAVSSKWSCLAAIWVWNSRERLNHRCKKIIEATEVGEKTQTEREEIEKSWGTQTSTGNEESQMISWRGELGEDRTTARRQPQDGGHGSASQATKKWRKRTETKTFNIALRLFGTSKTAAISGEKGGWNT